MGIEHPYLAILAVVAFIIAVIGVMYFFIHTYTEMLKTPVLSTYAESCYTDSSVYLNIILKHERGIPVVLQRIEIYTERGAVIYTPSGSLSNIDVVLEGFNGKLNTGQVGLVKMIFPLEYFIVNKTYYGLVFFDMGNTIFTFQLVKCSPLITPLVPKVRLVDMGVIAGNGTVIKLGEIKKVTGIINLYSRENVFYNDTFNTNPFTTGRLTMLSCNWNYDSDNKYIYIAITKRPDAYGDECVVVVNNLIPVSGTVYVAITIKAIRGQGYSDVVLIQDPETLYTLGVYFGSPSTNRGYEIWRYVEKEKKEWRSLESVKDETIQYNISYNIVAEYTFNTGYLALWSNGTLKAKATVNDSEITPIQTGLGTYTATTNNKRAAPSEEELFIVFDNLVVTINAPPWFINVTGVPNGWRVVLKNSTGGVVSNVTASGGIAILDVWGYFIVLNGTIEVYDEHGYLVASKTLEYIVGGEVYSLRVTEEEFRGLVVGLGGFSRILVYNITESLENPALTYIIDAGTTFNGVADIAIGNGYIYLLNTSGVFKYDFSQEMWLQVTDVCIATGIGAKLEVLRDVLIVIPGEGNNTICLYDMSTKNSLLHNILEGDVTAYTSTALSGNILYVSLNNTRPVIVAYSITNNVVSVVGLYNVTGYKLLGLTHSNITSSLYFIHEYSGVYELNTITGTLNFLPIILPFTPRGFGDRLEYYSEYLVFIRGDSTTELYIIPLTM